MPPTISMKALVLLCIVLFCSLLCNGHHHKECSLKKDAGECEDASLKWYYDSKVKRCKRFVYGGCGGNDNRFDTEAKCRRACITVH